MVYLKMDVTKQQIEEGSGGVAGDGRKDCSYLARAKSNDMLSFQCSALKINPDN